MQRSKLKKPVLILGLLVIASLGSYFGLFEALELITFDWRMKLQGKQLFSERIAIIEIADDSIAQLGRWPFDRKLHAQLIRILSEYGARQICLDIIFDQKSPPDKKESDEALISATQKAGNVYYPRGRNVDLIDGLRETARGSGHINIEPDIDGKRRRIPAFIKTEAESIPQLALVMAFDYLGKRNLSLPLDEKGNLLINYAGLWKETFKHYSYVDILVSYEQVKRGISPRMNLDELKDKICFIGLTAVGTTDIAVTPLETVYPMVGVNVNIFNSLITANFLKRASKTANLVILFLLMGLTLWLYKFLGSILKWVLWLSIVLIGFFAICLGFFKFFGLWIDLIFPAVLIVLSIFSLIFYSYLKERQKHLFLEHDLEIAAKLQQGFLSRTAFLQKKDLEIAAHMQPSRFIGGDFYDIIQLDNGHLCALIGDVTGKGVPASLYMALSISIFRTYIKLYSQPAKVLGYVNQELKERYPAGLFTTALLLFLDCEGKGYFANAGHLNMILLGKDKLVNLDTTEGLPLGISKDTNYNEAPLELRANETLVLFTDGVSEARKKGGEEFGLSRLQDLIEKNSFLPAAVLAGRIIQGACDFIKPQVLEDDLTVVVIKKGGRQ